jgi:predicted unusual protein kinase regulating ubiquinone biosynthesis (AarF/ABC1/UbiB family)
MFADGEEGVEGVRRMETVGLAMRDKKLGEVPDLNDNNAERQDYAGIILKCADVRDEAEKLQREFRVGQVAKESSSMSGCRAQTHTDQSTAWIKSWQDKANDTLWLTTWLGHGLSEENRARFTDVLGHAMQVYKLIEYILGTSDPDGVVHRVDAWEKLACAEELKASVKAAEGIFPKVAQNLADRPDIVKDDFVRAVLKDTQTDNKKKEERELMDYLAQQDVRIDFQDGTDPVPLFPDLVSFARSTDPVTGEDLGVKTLGTGSVGQVVLANVVSSVHGDKLRQRMGDTVVVKFVFEQNKERYASDWAIINFAQSLISWADRQLDTQNTGWLARATRWGARTVAGHYGIEEEKIQVPASVVKMANMFAVLEDSVMEEFNLFIEHDYTVRGKVAAEQYMALNGRLPGGTTVKVPGAMKTTSMYIMLQELATGDELKNHMVNIEGNDKLLMNWREDIYKNILGFYQYLVLSKGFWQADPHQGNWMYDQTSKTLWLIDWGAVGDLCAADGSCASQEVLSTSIQSASSVGTWVQRHGEDGFAVSSEPACEYEADSPRLEALDVLVEVNGTAVQGVPEEDLQTMLEGSATVKFSRRTFIDKLREYYEAAEAVIKNDRNCEGFHMTMTYATTDGREAKHHQDFVLSGSTTDIQTLKTSSVFHGLGQNQDGRQNIAPVHDILERHDHLGTWTLKRIYPEASNPDDAFQVLARCVEGASNKCTEQALPHDVDGDGSEWMVHPDALTLPYEFGQPTRLAIPVKDFTSHDTDSTFGAPAFFKRVHVNIKKKNTFCNKAPFSQAARMVGGGSSSAPAVGRSTGALVEIKAVARRDDQVPAPSANRQGAAFARAELGFEVKTRGVSGVVRKSGLPVFSESGLVKSEHHPAHLVLQNSSVASLMELSFPRARPIDIEFARIAAIPGFSVSIKGQPAGDEAIAIRQNQVNVVKALLANLLGTEVATLLELSSFIGEDDDPNAAVQIPVESVMLIRAINCFIGMVKEAATANSPAIIRKSVFDFILWTAVDSPFTSWSSSYIKQSTGPPGVA